MAPRATPKRSIKLDAVRVYQARAVSVQELGKLEGLAGLPLSKLETLRARMTVLRFSKRAIIYE